MNKRGLTKSFREKKLPKNIHHHQNTTNQPSHQHPPLNSSFEKQPNKKYPPIKPIFVIRKRNTSLLNPDLTNKQNKNRVPYENKKEDDFPPTKYFPFQSSKGNLTEKKNHSFKQNHELYQTELKPIYCPTDKEERTSSVRSKNKSKNKKINECRIRKVNWGNVLPFDLEVSRILQTEKGENEIESLQDLYRMMDKSEK